VNYVPLTDTIRGGQVKLFRQDLRAGETISITLSTLEGDADLYLFGPGGRLRFSLNPATMVDAIVFTAAQDGRYWIEVEGFAPRSVYSLRWTVGSRPLATLRTTQAVVPSGKSLRDQSVAEGVSDPNPNLEAIGPDTRPSATSVMLFVPQAHLNQVP
jgi:hypothetical protein